MANSTVSILMIDFKIQSNDRTESETKYYNLMRNKFSNQQQGRLIYLETRPKSYSYLPIEFTRDAEFVLESLQNSRKQISFKKFLIHIPIRILQNPKIIAKLCEIYSEDSRYLERYWNNFVQLFANNREIIVKSIEWNPLVLRHVSNELLNDYDIVMKAVGIDGYSLVYASESLRGNREIVKKAVTNHGFALFSSNNDLIRDVELQKLAIQSKPTVFKTLVQKISINEIDNQVIELAISLHGQSIAFVSHDYHDYRNLLLLAIENDGRALSFAPEILKSDREIVMKAVSCTGDAFFFVSTELKQDKEVVLKALESSTGFYLSLSAHLQNDLEIMQSAVKLTPRYTQFLHKKLDDQYVRSIIEKNPYLLQFAPQFNKDKNFVMKLVQIDGNVLKHVDKELRSDPEVILLAAHQNINSIQYAEDIDKELMYQLIDLEGFDPFLIWNNSAIKTDREVIIKVIKRNGKYLQYMDNSMRMDRELVSIAVETCGYAIILGNDFRNDYELVRKALLKSPSLNNSIPKSMMDRDLIKTIIGIDGQVLCDFPSLKDDIEIVMIAIKQNGKAFKYADVKLQQDEEMQLFVAKENGFCFKPNEKLFYSRMQSYYLGSYQPEHYPFNQFNNYETEIDGTHFKIPDYSEIAKQLQ